MFAAHSYCSSLAMSDEEATCLSQEMANNENPYAFFGLSIEHTACTADSNLSEACHCLSCCRIDSKLRDDIRRATVASGRSYAREMAQRHHDEILEYCRHEREFPFDPYQLPLYTRGDWPVEPPSYGYVVEVLDQPTPPPYTAFTIDLKAKRPTVEKSKMSLRDKVRTIFDANRLF